MDFNGIVDWISANYIWFLSGIGVTIVSFMFKFISKFFRSLFSASDPKTNSNVINQNITIGDVSGSKPQSSNENAIQPTRSKSSIPILFIDDQKVSFIPVIKKSGYSSIKYLKDCDQIDCNQVLESEVIFVDINGVGKNLFPTDQGLGLAVAIKKKFPHKCIVLYSAEQHYLKNEFRILDGILPKNSETYEFVKIIDDYINK